MALLYLRCTYPPNMSASVMHRLLGQVMRLCECMFQPTAAVSVSRQTMLVDGVSTTKCAVVLQVPALMKQTGIRLVCCIELFLSCVGMQVKLFFFCTQLNGTNTTYMDVCPLLEPSPSTPTGNYVQPVGVDRDIQLRTRNLPAPVSFNLCICVIRPFTTCIYMFNLVFAFTVLHPFTTVSPLYSPLCADHWIQVYLQFKRNS